mgnify:CR=1 FL=1
MIQTWDALLESTLRHSDSEFSSISEAYIRKIAPEPLIGAVLEA